MALRRVAGRVLLVAVVAGLPCRTPAQELDVHDLVSLDSLHTSSSPVARVGPLAITTREFFFNYVFGPSFPKRRPDSRSRYLEYMTYEKLLALGAEANGYGRDPRLISNLTALEGDAATEELYRDDILRNVSVDEAAVDRAVLQASVTVHLRWLYTKERNAAESLLVRLRSGIHFDTLFQRQLSDPQVALDDRIMTTTLFKLHHRNGALARAVDSLAPGVPSRPLKAPDGWYIVQVDSLWRSPVTTASQTAEARSDARRALTQIKADSLSDRYVRQLMLNADPVIERWTFDLLRAYIGAQRLSAARFEAWGLANRFRQEKDTVDYRQPEKYISRVLVTVRRGRITLGDFLVWYRLREANLSFRLESPQAFFLSLEDVVWRMVRDELLVKRAASRGLNSRQSVVVQKQWWREKLLYQLEKDSIRRTITWSDSTLRAYHAAHPRSFRDTSGALRPFEQVRDDVLRAWYDVTLSGRMLHRIVSMRQKFPVTVDEDALKQVPVDAENYPRAIDVYSVKKGGTFPHPAFPSIDQAWQTWQ